MRVATVLVFLIFSISNTAQDYDFGKVTKEELEEKFNPSDSSASATYLYKSRNTYFNYSQQEGFSVITEIQERIKIYNTDGFKYATCSVNLYKDGNEKMDFSGLKAYAYSLVNDKIEESKLEKDGVFKTEKSKYTDEVKFTLPNIKEGCIVEYKYRINSPFYSYIEEFKFQHDIPIKKIEAKFETPEYFNFKPRIKGYLRVVPKFETKIDKIHFTEKTRSGFYMSTTKVDNYSVDYEKHISKFDLTDVPALKEEPYVNNIDNYRSSVKYELSYTKFPQSIMKFYSTTWEDVVKTIYENSSFGDELNKTNYFENDIDVLIGSISDPVARMGLIYDFVKTKVKWNDYLGIYVQDGVRQAYKNQTGNVAEINLMLTAMLRYAGLEANPVLVSTRSHGIPTFPTREGYNYVIAGIEINDTVVLLDATSKYSVPNVLPFRALNWEGRIIKKNGSSTLVNLYPQNKSDNTVMMMATLSETGNLEGQIRTTKQDHEALAYRELYIESNKEQFLEKLENKYGGMEIEDFKLDNDLDLSKPIVETYKYTMESQADIIGNKIYFSPLLFLRTKQNPFKLEKREFPIDFGYPKTSTYRISVVLPNGYKVEILPEAMVLKLTDNLGTFTYQIISKGNSIQLVVNEEINTSIITPLYYEILKDFYKKLIDKQNEQVVLTKA